MWRRSAQGPWNRFSEPSDLSSYTIGADDAGHVYIAGEGGALYLLRGDRRYLMWTGPDTTHTGTFGVGGELFLLPGQDRTLMHGR